MPPWPSSMLKLSANTIAMPIWFMIGTAAPVRTTHGSTISTTAAVSHTP